jgi:hypothetical protein
MRWRICSLDIEHLWCVIQHRYIGADVQCAIKVDLQHECNAVVRVRWRPVGRDVAPTKRLAEPSAPGGAPGPYSLAVTSTTATEALDVIICLWS